jgi:hypothetical protein
MKPMQAVGRGMLAGLVGTAAMTAVQELYAKLHSDGGLGVAEKPNDPWEQASAPAKVGKRIVEGVLIGPFTHGMHWGYGTVNGVAFGLVQPSLSGHPLRNGLGFGAAVMASSYAQLIPIGLYEFPWKYSPQALATELGFHLAYGLGVGAGWMLVSD